MVVKLPPVRSRRIRPFVIVGGVLTLLVLLAIAVPWLMYKNAVSTHSEGLESEKDKTLGYRLVDLRPTHPEGVTNGASLWRKVFSRLEGDNGVLSELQTALIDNKVLTPAEHERGIRLLSRHDDTLALAREAIRTTSLFWDERYDSDYTAMGWEIRQQEHHSQAWVFAGFLRLRAEIAPESRLDTFRLLYGLADNLRTEPTIKDLLLRIALTRYSWDSLKKWLREGMDDSDRKEVLAYLSTLHPKQDLKRALRYDRALGIETFERLLDGRMPSNDFLGVSSETGALEKVGGELLLSRLSIAHSYREYLRSMREAHTAIDTGFPGAYSELKRIRDALERNAQTLPSTGVAYLLFPQVASLLEFVTHWEAEIAIATLILSGDERLPLDPYTGKSMIMRREGEREVVRSLGLNGQDDQGRDADDYQNDDIVWELPEK